MSENTPQQPQNPPAQPPAYVAPPTYSAPPSYSTATPPYAAQPPAYAPGAYPAPAYGYAPAQKTNTLAIIGMIASIVGFIWILPLIGSIAGAIMGHISLSQIKRTGEKGRGMALAAVIVGWVGLALLVLGVILIIMISVAAYNSSGRYSS